MGSQKGLMAAIMAAIEQRMEEEAVAMAPPRRHLEVSFWKYAGLQEIMAMRSLWQMRERGSATYLPRPGGG